MRDVLIYEENDIWILCYFPCYAKLFAFLV